MSNQNECCELTRAVFACRDEKLERIEEQNWRYMQRVQVVVIWDLFSIEQIEHLEKSKSTLKKYSEIATHNCWQFKKYVIRFHEVLSC